MFNPSGLSARFRPRAIFKHVFSRVQPQSSSRDQMSWICFLGITRVCPRTAGARGKNARVLLVSYTTCAGSRPSTIRQKLHFSSIRYIMPDCLGTPLPDWPIATHRSQLDTCHPSQISCVSGLSTLLTHAQLRHAAEEDDQNLKGY